MVLGAVAHPSLVSPSTVSRRKREDSRDSNIIVNVHVDALWEGRNMGARSPEKLMNVSDVEVSGEEWSLFLHVTCQANTKIVKERFGMYRVAGEMVFQSELPVAQCHGES